MWEWGRINGGVCCVHDLNDLHPQLQESCENEEELIVYDLSNILNLYLMIYQLCF